MWYYDGNHFGGMHFFWWFIWIIIMVWIFATPYDIPGNRKSKNMALDVLDKKFADGTISQKEYEEKKDLILKR